jgi:hypothetical protein
MGRRGMKTIWKYILEPDKLSITMPKNAKILTVREQHGSICMWAEVDSENETETRVFSIYGTGHRMPRGMGLQEHYIGTAMLSDGNLVFHVYEHLTS